MTKLVERSSDLIHEAAEFPDHGGSWARLLAEAAPTRERVGTIREGTEISKQQIGESDSERDYHVETKATDGVSLDAHELRRTRSRRSGSLQSIWAHKGWR
jgi:hypothetical protein